MRIVPTCHQNAHTLIITTRSEKTQHEPHLYSADHAGILGLANTLAANAEHQRMSSIKIEVCEGEVDFHFNALRMRDEYLGYWSEVTKIACGMNIRDTGLK